MITNSMNEEANPIDRKNVEIEFGGEIDIDLVHFNHFKVCGKDFNVIKLVGTGGYGKVYKVVKVGGPDDTRVLAMKVVRKSKIIRNVKDTAHTKSERSVLASSRHPFIVELIYAFQTVTSLYFIMEFCFGGELFQLLEKKVRLPLDAVRFYMAEIVLALEYLHRLCVVYRDLKPENIMLDAEGHVKLTDFGMSKENIGVDSVTYTFCGTPDYMAPEVLQKCGHGIAVDWWTLGAVSYDMLVGQPPFACKNRDGMIQKILFTEVEFPPMAGCWDFQNLILGLLVKDPDYRFRVGEVKGHAFFDAYSWDDVFLRKLSPPFTQIVVKSRSSRQGNFEYSTISSLEDSDPSTPFPGVEEFQGFSYVADSLLKGAVQTAVEEEGVEDEESLNMSEED